MRGGPAGWWRGQAREEGPLDPQLPLLTKLLHVRKAPHTLTSTCWEWGMEGDSAKSSCLEGEGALLSMHGGRYSHLRQERHQGRRTEPDQGRVSTLNPDPRDQAGPAVKTVRATGKAWVLLRS